MVAGWTFTRNRTGRLHFTRHHGFEVKRYRPYRPRTKGKVERSVSYLRDSFLNGRTFSGLDYIYAQGRLHAVAADDE